MSTRSATRLIQRAARVSNGAGRARVSPAFSSFVQSANPRVVLPSVANSNADTQPWLTPARSYASHADAPQPQGTPAMVGAQLRGAIEGELHNLAAAVPKSGHRYLRPLTPEETEFVNMGQVPAFDNSEILGLLDLNLLEPPFDREKPRAGPDGSGVHVPLLALVGSTEPIVPCYPLRDLFEGLAPRVVRSIHAVLQKQGGQENDEAAPLVAILVPADGDKRDLAMPLALSLFRLAIHEGNGHTEEAS